MSQENVEIARGMYEAYAHRDEVTPFERYAPDVEWDHGDLELVGGDGVYHGHDGIGAHSSVLVHSRAAQRFQGGDACELSLTSRSPGI